jgi:hypothetical protein
MNVGNKTLAVLSEEAKEKHYVTLDVGAKVSGYTKDYLEHLCRINKVESRVWNNGQFVIELESLLTETHTILLSYEDIEFVDKAELDDPTPQIVTSILTAIGAGVPVHTQMPATEVLRARMQQKVADGITQSIPTFGEGFAGAISRVGRSVVSDPLHPEKAEPESEENLLAHVVQELPSTPPPPTVTAVFEAEIPQPHEAVVLSESRHAPIHLRVTGEHAPTTDGLPQSVLHVPIVDENIDETLPLSRFHTKNPLLHPIVTAQDASEHHDDAPLFPVLSRTAATLPSTVVSHTLNATEAAPPKLSAVAVPILVRSEVSVVIPPPQDIEPPVQKILLPKETILPATPLPQEVMPQPSHIPMSRTTMLPSITPEHHLMTRPDMSITRSPVLNIAFALLVAGTVFTLGEQVLFPPPESQVASVVNPSLVTEVPASIVLPAQAGTTTEAVLPDPYALPFSDDVVRSTSTPGIVDIAPIVDGVTEDSVAYPIP